MVSEFFVFEFFKLHKTLSKFKTTTEIVDFKYNSEFFMNFKFSKTAQKIVL